MSSPVISLNGVVKNSTTNAGLTGATISVGSTTTTTALNKSPFISSAQAAGGNEPADPGSYNLFLNYTNSSPTSYQVTASKSGFDPQTKTFNINPNSCTYSGTLNFTLVPTGTSGSSGSGASGSQNTSTSNKTTTTSTAPVDTSPKLAIEEFKKIVWPATFSKTKTTDIASITDHSKVKGFTIAVDDKNEIKFEEELDLSSQNTIDKLKEADKYIKVDKIGTIEVDSTAIPSLAKKAKLTMHKLTGYVAPPGILVDGKADTQKIVGKVTYDKKLVQLALMSSISQPSRRRQRSYSSPQPHQV